MMARTSAGWVSGASLGTYSASNSTQWMHVFLQGTECLAGATPDTYHTIVS